MVRFMNNKFVEHSNFSAFAQEHHLRFDKYIALMLDLAGWQKSSRLAIPEGLHLLFWPSHSPELQPVERLWPLSNESLVNRVFAVVGCKLIQGAFEAGPPYRWWPPSLDTT